MGCATVSSTTCALAPGKLADTLTTGGVIWGNSAIGRDCMHISPARVMTMDMTNANLGRSMKKALNTVCLARISHQGPERWRRTGVINTDCLLNKANNPNIRKAGKYIP